MPKSNRRRRRQDVLDRRLQGPHTCPIFGTAQRPYLLEPNKEGYGVIDAILHSDGSGEQHLYMKAGGSRYPASEETVRNNWHTITQDGPAVFKAAVSNMANVSEEMMQRHHLTAQDIRYLVPHQPTCVSSTRRPNVWDWDARNV